MHEEGEIDQLLSDFISQNPGVSRPDIELMMWRKYGTNGAVFILDMSGFSSTTKKHGIVYYLSMIKRMQKIVAPIITKYEGQLVKFEADNSFAYFPDSEKAVLASFDILEGINESNKINKEHLEIEISIGIDSGHFLYLKDRNDFFGNPVNIASKLGEDIAKTSEILITDNAFNEVKNKEKYIAKPRKPIRYQE